MFDGFTMGDMTYSFEVNVRDEILDWDGNGKNMLKNILQKYPNMTTYVMIKDLEKLYEYYYKHDEYPKWKDISFEKKKFNGQYYLMAKARVEPLSKKKSETGGCWYITIKNGTDFEFQFSSEHPTIDESVISEFDEIMKSVKYS